MRTTVLVARADAAGKVADGEAEPKASPPSSTDAGSCTTASVWVARYAVSSA